MSGKSSWVSSVCGRVAAGLVAIGSMLALSTALADAAPASFGVEGSSAGQISHEPAGAAVDQETGDVYVTDRNNNRIDKFQGEGAFLLAWGWGVADGATNALQQCTLTCFGGTGAPFEGSGTGQFTRAEGNAVDNDLLSPSHGDVYVVDTSNRRVQKFGPEGEFVAMFGGKVNVTTKGNVCFSGETCQAGVQGKASGEFTGLTGQSIAIDATGTVYVGDENRVQLFSEAGAVTGEIALPGAGLIEGLAVDSSKDIYVSSSKKLGVRKYDSTGTELGAARDEATIARAIAVGPADELFVNDRRASEHHLFIFDPTGKQTASFDAGTVTQDGGRGIAYSVALKALYVLTPGTVRIAPLPTPGPLVLAGRESAGELQTTGATLCATINPQGAALAHYYFDYGPTAAYGQSTSEEELSGGGSFTDQHVCTTVTGLLPGAVYHFRAVATDGTNTAEGADQTFTTLPPVSIDAAAITEVNATSAQLQAELNPHGLPSEYRFDYGTSAAYGTSVPVPDGSLGSGVVDVAVSEPIQGLLPSTTYHYRVVAHNELGVVESADQTFTTQGPSSTLPDGRAWEMVSPPNKHGSPLEPITEEGGLIQAAAAGGAFSYVALGPINGEPAGVRSPHDTQLLARRDASGWSTQDITTPHEEISKIHPGFPSEYKFFAASLSSSLVEPEGATPLSPNTTERTPYLREASGEFVPLLTAANVPAGTKFGGEEAKEGFGKSGAWTGGVEFRAATPDLSHVVVASPQVLAPGFSESFLPTETRSLYELSGGTLQLVSVLPGGEPAVEAKQGVSVGRNNLDMRGAISNDGSRVVFESGPPAHLYMRDLVRKQTLQLDVRQPGAPAGTGVPAFQAANDDGTRVFFTDTAKLTPDASAQDGLPDLYMCEVVADGEGALSCSLSDLTADPNAGEAADVRGRVSAIDAAGGHVYFAANGVLTNAPNAQGEHAVPGECETSSHEAPCNLYVYDTDAKHLSLVTVLSSADRPDWAGLGNLAVLGNLTARSSPNGDWFTFMSRRSLTGYDNHDARGGEPDEEVFLFDADSGTVRCVSCNPTGARPRGVGDMRQFPGLLVDHPRTWWEVWPTETWLAGSIPGWTLGPSHEVALYQSRYLSDSGRMFFNAADGLVPQDTNHVEDVYQYEPPGVGGCKTTSTTYSPASGGCVGLISSGASKEESAFLDASESGDEAFFITVARLSTSDVDSALDVYDAHVCTDSSPCPPPPPTPAPACDGDSCQNPGTPPVNITPSSLTYHGPGNAPPPAPAVAKPKRPPTRAQLLAQALKSCKRKHAKKKRLACERQARKRYGPKTKKQAKARKSSHAKARTTVAAGRKGQR